MAWMTRDKPLTDTCSSSCSRTAGQLVVTWSSLHEAAGDGYCVRRYARRSPGFDFTLEQPLRRRAPNKKHGGPSNFSPRCR